MTNLETNYLTYPEAIKEAVVPGYKSDWPDKEVESNDSNESEDDLSNESSDNETTSTEEETQTVTPDPQEQTENPE